MRPHENIQQLAYKLEQAYPSIKFTGQLKIEDPKNWANVNLQNIYFIYSISALTKPSATYYQNGQAIAKTQIVLAGYRLSREMNKNLN